MTDIRRPVLIRFPWFTLYGMPDRPGRLARLRCTAAMVAHEIIEQIAGTAAAHSTRSARRFQIGAPTISVPASERNRLFFTTIAAGYPDLYAEPVGGHVVECRMFASGTVDSNFESVYDPGELVEIAISNPATGNWERVIGIHGHGYGLASPERVSLSPLPTINPVVTHDNSVWDAGSIREHGQAIYDPETDQWILLATGKLEAFPYYSQIGAYLSSDGGETWAAHPQNPILPHFAAHIEWGNDLNNEDPYIAKTVNGVVYRDSLGRALIYCEEKEQAGHYGVTVWTSAPNTLSDWEYAGVALQGGSGGGTYTNDRSLGDWDYTDRPSPTVIFDGTQHIMLYEGRYLPSPTQWPEWAEATAYDLGDIAWVDGPLTYYRCLEAHTSTSTTPDTLPALWEVYEGQQGAVGIAFSTDEGMTFTPAADPIIVPRPDSWNEVSLVPDDVMLVNGVWVLMCHGQQGFTYREGRYFTTDEPADWDSNSFAEMVGNPFSTSNTVMCWGNDPTQALIEDGNNLVRVYVTPTVGSTAVDLSSIESQIGVHGDRLDDLEGVDTDLLAADVALDGRILNSESDIMRAYLATGRTAPSTTIAAFDFTTGDFGGTPPDAVTLTFPASLATPALPWIDVGAPITALAISAPTAPSSDHRLVGAKIRVVATGVDQLTDVLATIAFGGPFACKVGSLGAWRSNTANGANLSPDHADVEVEQDVVLLLDEPLASGDLGSMLLIGGFVVSGESPSIGTGATLDFPIEPEWLWDTDIASGTATLNEVVGLGIAGTHTLTEAGAYTIQDGGTITLPSAASMPGAEVSVQHITSSGGGGTLTINPFSGEYMQRGWGNDSFTTSSLVIDTDAMMIWRAATAAGFGVDAWVLVSLDYQGESGTVDFISNVGTGTIIGRATAGSGDSEELSASTARTVMGLGTAATTSADDYATAAQGTLATNAVPAGGTEAYGLSLLTLASQAELASEVTGFIERSRYVTVSSNDWPTFTSVPTADWYRLRWFREIGTPAAAGGLPRNLVLTLDADATSGNYFNTTTSATAIAVAAFGQGGGGFGQIVFRRVQYTSTIHGLVGEANAVISVSTGTNTRVSSAHSYRKAAGGVPDLTSWAISASNNDTWAVGWTFILETGVDP